MTLTSEFFHESKTSTDEWGKRMSATEKPTGICTLGKSKQEGTWTQRDHTGHYFNYIIPTELLSFLLVVNMERAFEVMRFKIGRLPS
jgi:hypothetical protein